MGLCVLLEVIPPSFISFFHIHVFPNLSINLLMKDLCLQDLDQLQRESCIAKLVVIAKFHLVSSLSCYSLEPQETTTMTMFEYFTFYAYVQGNDRRRCNFKLKKNSVIDTLNYKKYSCCSVLCSKLQVLLLVIQVLLLCPIIW